ncbi:hypothetical protein BDF14DRAFT_1036295 [Spinellus fusiger]|nr:hypothetical protein BDF14DRAFT_1036295 [Spinellus fusiger]
MSSTQHSTSFQHVRFVPGTNLESVSTLPTQKKTNGNTIAEFYKQITTNLPMTTTSESQLTASTAPTVYCKDCNMNILTASYQDHRKGLAHMVSRPSGPTPDILGLNGSNKGFQMLRAQGWQYEEGLGSHGQGRRHPIPTVWKQDRLCIGHEKTGPKAVTHSHKTMDRKAIALQAKNDTLKRAAMIHYMNQ